MKYKMHKIIKSILKIYIFIKYKIIKAISKDISQQITIS